MTIHCHVAAPMTHLQVVQKGVHSPLFAIPELLKRRQLFLVVAMLAQRGRCARQGPASQGEETLGQQHDATTAELS